MSNIQLFSFRQTPFTTVQQHGQSWFIANEICAVLEINNPRQALTRLRDYEKADVTINDTSSNGVFQQRTVNGISYSGALRLVLTSRKPEAEAFQDWLVLEVIPSIMATGRYEMNAPASYEHHPLVDAICAYIAEKGDYLGTMTALFDKLSHRVSIEDVRTQLWPREWPDNPQKMGMALERVKPALATRGVEFSRRRPGGVRQVCFRFAQSPKQLA